MIPISDADLDRFEMTFKEVAERKPKVRERLAQILRRLERIREHISQNDARRAVFATLLLDSELHNCGYAIPFYAKLSLAKATRASAESRAEKFDWYAIQEEANEIWKRHKSYSKLRVARLIQERFEERDEPDILKSDTIRKKINKPT
jgi:hypothetical protein